MINYEYIYIQRSSKVYMSHSGFDCVDRLGHLKSDPHWPAAEQSAWHCARDREVQQASNLKLSVKSKQLKVGKGGQHLASAGAV